MLLSRGARLAARSPSLPQLRGLCTMNSIQVDTVARVYSCKVKDEPSAVMLDDAFDEVLLDSVADHNLVWGASRLVCKSQLDYKFILKFTDVDALNTYVTGHNDELMKQLKPKIAPLINGELHEQNFVYDDIDE
ncbi:hypothetical protein AB1Y20_003962 [Prymnesium parvum]|uniref:Stress-response A/B barrel domain-containing protein n=1 Tax=Prymnesium parvum TaxID=97485 RepID=A0AB34J823_PRYPA